MDQGCLANKQTFARIRVRNYRSLTEVESLLGDPRQAKNKLGWEPRVTLEEMITEMVQNDLQIAKKNRLLIKSGYDVNQTFE